MFSFYIQQYSYILYLGEQYLPPPALLLLFTIFNGLSFPPHLKVYPALFKIPFVHFHFQRKKHIRVIRSAVKIIATPSASVSSRAISITLSIDDPSKLPNGNMQYQWSCSKNHAFSTLFQINMNTFVSLQLQV